MKIACIIPTVITENNVKNLNNLLESISIQEFTVGPSQIIIVYYRDIDFTFLSNSMKKWHSLDIVCVESPVASSAYQRNIGVKHVAKDVSFVLFLDDDIIFYKDSFKEMHKCLENYAHDSSIGGFAFNIISDNTIKSKFYFMKYLFLMGDYKRGNVLPSGFATMICPVTENIRTKWLFSGASLWRREVFDEFEFDNWYADYGFGEDLDFSYGVGKKYTLMVCAAAKVKHVAFNIFLRDNYLFGEKQVLNRFHFIKKYKEFSIVFFLWAITGLFLHNILFGLIRFNLNYFKRVIGNVIGVSKLRYLK